MLRDRGIKKWVSLMLPEHVQTLKDLEMEDLKVKKPILDEQQYEELNRVIFDAFVESRLVHFFYYSNGAIKSVTGIISLLDGVKREIHIVDQCSNTIILNMKNIVKIEE